MPHYGDLNLPIIEAGVDWITATRKRDNHFYELANYADRLMLQQVNSGDKCESWAYQGYNGFQAGPVRWGHGVHGAIAIFSGPLAANVIARVAKLADHISRLDYQVTVLDDTFTIDPTEEYWSATASGPETMAATPNLQRIQDRRGGRTISVGDRASAKYLRCYNKYVESKGDYPKGAWRFELELKREASENEHSIWAKQLVPLDCQISTIATFLKSHHLAAPFSATGSRHIPGRIKRPRDADRILTWLTTQVRPSVEWVSQARGTDVVRSALNL
jgi:replication initiation factor